MQKDKPIDKWLELSADIENLQAFHDMVISEAHKYNLSSETVSKIELSLEEILVNVINYAYSQGNKGTISVRCCYSDEQMFSITIKDRGKPFNPIEKESPELTSSIDERQIGGVGLVLVRQMTDKLEYRRTGEENILHLGFKISEQQD